jgi:hypothetical protein
VNRRGEWYEWPFEPLPVLRALSERKVIYVLIGGLAAVLQGSPLPTYDIDIAPAPSAENQERLAAALTDLGAGAPTDVTAAGAFTPYGYIDVHPGPAGFDDYTQLRRNAVPISLEHDLTVLVSPLRDIIRSRVALGDERQLPALEATLELAG